MSKSALARALYLSLFGALLAACADDKAPEWFGRDERDAEAEADGRSDEPARDGRAPEDDGSQAIICRDLCGLGQVCDDSASPARCVGSCEDVSCASGRVCAVIDDVGTCMAMCNDSCGDGQRCDTEQDPAECVDNSCDYLACGASEACVPAQAGGGFRCVDNSCADDVDCESTSACVGSVCLADVCAPGTQTCDGAAVRECASNGAGT